MFAPLMAHLLHIRPWEHDLLTVEQLDAALSWIEQHNRAQSTGG